MKRSGFTLVELSVVLVIIGLIVGGVLVGRDLIQASQFRKAMSEKEQILAAIHTFRAKYNALPGDMSNATSYWTQDASCNGSRTTGGTCNGSGNNQIIDGGPWVATGGTSYEGFNLWQHLSLAGLIANINYAATFTPGLTCPASAMANNLCWQVVYMGNGSAHGLFPANYGNALFLSNAGIGNNSSGGISPSDMKILDTKYDDGLAGYGNIRSLSPSGLGQLNLFCATSGSQAAAQYNTSNTGKDCAVVIPTGLQ